MLDEDIVIAKLKGYDCFIKFKDGEELLIKCDLDGDSGWFTKVEDYINNTSDDPFPLDGLAISRDAIKYVKKL